MKSPNNPSREQLATLLWYLSQTETTGLLIVLKQDAEVLSSANHVQIFQELGVRLPFTVTNWAVKADYINSPWTHCLYFFWTSSSSAHL